jgi:large subunit ribosomal protein L17
MRHRVRKTTLGRTAGPRKALLKVAAEQVLLYEHITTTLAKAKALRPIVERLITTAKKGDLTARRRLLAALPTERGAAKALDVLGKRFANRPGGYTRIIKLVARTGDRAPMAVLQLVDVDAKAK